MFIDVSASGTARMKKITRTDFLSSLGVVSDTFKVKVASDKTEGFLDERVTATDGLHKSISGNNLVLKLNINGLTEGTNVLADREVVFFDSDAMENRKATINNLIAHATIDGGIF